MEERFYADIFFTFSVCLKEILELKIFFKKKIFLKIFDH